MNILNLVLGWAEDNHSSNNKYSKPSVRMSLSSVGFSSVQDDAHVFTMHFTPSLRSFLKAAFEAVPMMRGGEQRLQPIGTACCANYYPNLYC